MVKVKLVLLVVLFNIFLCLYSTDEHPISPPPDVNLNIRPPPNEENDNTYNEENVLNDEDDNDNFSNENMENEGANASTMDISPSFNFKYCNSKCPFEKNCIFTQITSNFTEYGCSLCSKDTYLEADKTGSGKCKSKNTIEHCIAAQTSPSYKKKKLYCWACEKDYILSRDLSNCSKKIDKKFKIPHCDHYYQNTTDTSGIVCNACEDGYTLSSDMKKCIKGCELQNCAKCQMLGDAPFCFMCKKDYIGILSQKVFLYTDCMSCNDVKHEACPNRN